MFPSIDFIRLTALGSLLLALAAGPAIPASQGEADRVGDPAAAIHVLFKLDSRLTQGQYMGERWVSPPTFTQVGRAKQVTVEAKAEEIAVTGNPAAGDLRWTPDDPKMVEVSPPRGKSVQITVLHPGKCTLVVAGQGSSRTLSITASNLGEALRVDISQ